MIRHSSPRLEYGALLIMLVTLTATIHQINAAPTVNHDTDLSTLEESDGCYYNYNHYSEGDRIMTNEPCLNCTCHNQMLMCYLRVCPFTKPIGQDCVVEKREDQCCPIITCPEVPVELEPHAGSGSTELGHPDTYGCTIDNKFYTEGSQVPSSPHKPCELCYCIRNMTTCVMQECTLHVEGCQPVYHRGVCCPVRYECDHDSEGPLMLEDETTTTVRPTPGFMLTTTLSPSTDCVHDGKVIADGGLVDTGKPCDHCYCMRGDIVCVVMECLEPSTMEGKNCTAVAPKKDECCPQDYICDGDVVKAESFATTLSPTEEMTTESSEDDKKQQPSDTKTRFEGEDETTSGPEDATTAATSEDATTTMKPPKVDHHRKITKKPLEGEVTATTVAPEDEQEQTPTEKSELKPDEQTHEPMKETTKEPATTVSSIDRTDAPLDEIEPQVTLRSDDQAKAEDDEHSTDAPKATEKPESTEVPDDGKPTDAPQEEKSTEAPKPEDDLVTQDAPKKEEEDLQEKTTIAPEDRLSTFIPDMDKTTRKPDLEDETMDMNTVMPDVPVEDKVTSKPDKEDMTTMRLPEETDEDVSKVPTTASTLDETRETTIRPRLDDEQVEHEEDVQKLEPLIPETTYAPEHTTLAHEDLTTVAPKSDDKDDEEPHTTLKSLETGEDEPKSELDEKTEAPIDTPTTTKHDDESLNEIPESMDDTMKEQSTTVKAVSDSTEAHTVIPAEDDELQKHIDEDEEVVKAELPETTATPMLHETHKPEFDRGVLGEGEHTTVRPEDKLSTFIPDLEEKTTSKPDSDRDDLELPPAQVFTELPEMPEMTTMKLPEDEIIEPAKPVESDSHMMVEEEDETKKKPTEDEPLEMNTVIPESPVTDKDVEQQTVGLDDIWTTLAPIAGTDEDKLLSSIDKILETYPTSKPDELPDMGLPQAIPGEGDCLFDGQHFRHNSTIPSPDRCLVCVCLNSAVRCNQTCDDLPLETTDKSEEAIVESSEVPAVVVEMTPQPQSEEEVTAIVKEMYPTTLSPVDSEDQTTVPSEMEGEEQVTVDLGLKADVPEEEATDKPSDSEQVTDKPEDHPKSDATDAPIVELVDKMTEKPLDSTTAVSDDETSTDKATGEDEVTTDVPSQPTETPEIKKPESTEEPIEEDKSTVRIQPLPEDESTDLPSVQEAEKATEHPEKTTLAPEADELPKKEIDEATTSHEEPEKSTDSPVMPQEEDKKTESPLDSTTALPSDSMTTFHPDDMPKEEVQTHAPPAIESLEKVTEAPAEPEKMTDRPEEDAATTSHKDEGEKMTESPVEKTTLAAEKDVAEKETEQPSVDEKVSTTLTAEKDQATTLAPEKDDEEKADKEKPLESTTFTSEKMDEATTAASEKDDELKKDEDESTEKDHVSATLRPESEEKMTEQPKLDETTLSHDAEQTTEHPIIEDRLDTIPQEPEEELTKKPEFDEAEKVTTAVPSEGEDSDMPKHDATMKPELDDVEKATTSVPSEVEKSTEKPDSDLPKEDATTIKSELPEATTALPSEDESTDKPEMKPEGTEAQKEEEDYTTLKSVEQPVEDQVKLDAAKPTEAPTEDLDKATHKAPVDAQEPSEDSTTLRSELPTEAVTEVDEEIDVTTTKVTQTPVKGHKKPVTEMIDGTMVEIVTPSSEIKTEAPETYEIVTPLSVEHEMAGTTVASEEEEEEKDVAKTTVAPEETKKDEPEQTTDKIGEKQTTLKPDDLDEEKVQEKLTTMRPAQEPEEQTAVPAHDDDLMDKQTTLRPDEETKAEHDATTLSSEPAKPDEQEKATTSLPVEDHTEAHLDKDEDDKVMTVTPSKEDEAEITEAPKQEVPSETEASMTESPDKHDDQEEEEKVMMTDKPSGEHEEDMTTEQPKLPAPEEIETKTELPYGLVTERLPEELTTILAQSGLDLTTMRIEHDHTMEPEKDDHTTVKAHDEDEMITDAPKHEVDDRIDVQTEKEEMAEGTTVAPKTEDQTEKSTEAPLEEHVTEKDMVKAEEPEIVTIKQLEVTTVKAEDEDDEKEISKTTLAPEHEMPEDTKRPEVDATTVKSEDESKSEVEDKTTVAPVHEEEADVDKTTSHPEGIDTKFGEESDKDEERHEEAPTATTIHPTTSSQEQEDSHEEDVQRPVDHYPEEHTAKPPQPTYGTPAAPGFDPSNFGQMPSGYPSSPDNYDDYEDTESDPSLFGPGTCRYGGKLYVSAQQIPRDDPCDFCFCFRSDIICLQQSCPPPINGCHEETIDGFCCPRYECPVSMATVVNITTSTTTTTTTLPPHFNRHAYKGATRAGCFIDGRTYQVGDVIERNTGPCMQCKCGADAQMECLPLNCSPEPMLRQMMEQHLMSSRRRR